LEKNTLSVLCLTGIYNSSSTAFLHSISKVFKKLNNDVKNVDVVFLVEDTTNTKPYIRKISTVINNFSYKLKKCSPIGMLRIGASVYRHYADGNKINDIIPLTTDISKIKKWLHNVYSNPIKSPGEIDAIKPKALLNGIEQTVKKAGFGRYHTKFLIVIGDSGKASMSIERYPESSEPGIGTLLSLERIICIILKVNDSLKQGGDEKGDWNLFKQQVENIKNSYIERYSAPIPMGNSMRDFPRESLEMLCKIEEINSPKFLLNRLNEDYIKRISDFVDDMIKDYQKCINWASISLRDIYKESFINPTTFEALKEFFGKKFDKVIQNLITNRAYIMGIGYTKEIDPRSPKISQFKNVYLFRKIDIADICRDLENVLTVLNNQDSEKLWGDFISRKYRGQYDPQKCLNDYAKLLCGITYKNLTGLFDMPLGKIVVMDYPEKRMIIGKVYNVYKKLKNLLEYGPDRLIGLPNDPYIWLYEEELP
jgi:hypothetical protein